MCVSNLKQENKWGIWPLSNPLDPSRATEEQREQQENIMEYTHPLYQVFTRLQSWSVCDRCGIPGEQVRVGLCYVRSRFLHVRYRWANQTIASCGSGALPGALKPPKQRPVLQVKSCEVPCTTKAPPPRNLLNLIPFLGYRWASFSLSCLLKWI